MRGRPTKRCPMSGCYAGRLRASCPTCARSRPYPRDAATCASCFGTRLVQIGVCPLCDGAGEVPVAFERLYVAHQRIRAEVPDWDGDDAVPASTTGTSLAKWYRCRGDLAGRIGAFRGRPLLDHRFGVVEGVNQLGAVVISLHALSWGYSGAGPTALATIIADCWDLNEYESARAVGGLPLRDAWRIDHDQIMQVRRSA
jgi:hypothetical protein